MRPTTLLIGGSKKVILLTSLVFWINQSFKDFVKLSNKTELLLIIFFIRKLQD